MTKSCTTYSIYVKTHKKTGLKYLGYTKHNPFIYKGSGKYWRRHLREHGNDVSTEVVFETVDKSEIKVKGTYFSKLWRVVESTQWANLKPEEGDGGGVGTPGINKSTTTVTDKSGLSFRVSVNDPRLDSGEVAGVRKGLVVVKDALGNKFTVSKTDPRYLTGEVVHHSKGTSTYVNSSGEIRSLAKDDPMVVSGEFVGINVGKVSVKDKDGNQFKVLKTDLRYLSGELVGVNLGKSIKHKARDKVICDVCGKTGDISLMKRYHFENCKYKQL